MKRTTDNDGDPARAPRGAGRHARLRITRQSRDGPRPPERDVARLVQGRLLPGRLPAVEGLAVAAHYAPAADGAGARGDWYDALRSPDGSLAVSAGDVVGAGPDAAAVMGQLRSVLRASLLEGRGPGDALAALDTYARAVEGAGACTAVCAVIHPADGAVVWARAGHPPPVAVGAGHARHLEELDGPLLGAVPDARHAEQCVTLPVGHSLVLYSDGLVARRGGGAGTERLAGALAAAAPAPGALVDAARALGGPPDDDAVALAVTRTLPPLHARRPARAEGLSALRDELREWMAPLAVSERMREDMVLAVGEAAANAIEHAYPAGAAGTVQTDYRHDGDGLLRLTVDDDGRWRDDDGRADELRGRGLPIIRAVAESLRIEATAAGTRVAVCFRPDAHEGARGPRDTVADGGDAGAPDGRDLDGPAMRRLLAARTDGTLDLRRAAHLGSDAVAELARAARAAACDGLRLRVRVDADRVAARVLRLTGLADELDMVT